MTVARDSNSPVSIIRKRDTLAQSGQMVISAGFLTCVLLISTSCADALYHIASTRSPCQISAPENQSLDLLCSHNDLEISYDLETASRRVSCQVASIQWQRMTPDGAINISKSAKYGVWMLHQHLEDARLLRIRDIQQEDVGSYRCRVECVEQESSLVKRRRVTYQLANICLSLTNHVLCGVQLSTHSCRNRFWDGVCDPDCDNEEHLYDGFDCANDQHRECPPEMDANCRRIYANGVCDVTCDDMGCAWDGGDCVDKPLQFARNVLVLSLPRWYQSTGKIINGKLIARNLSKLLRTIIRVLPDDWFSSENAWGPGRVGAPWHRPQTSDHRAIRRLYFKIDSTLCYGRCFADASNVAQFITLAMIKGWDPGIHVSAVRVVSEQSEPCDVKNNTLLHIGDSKPAQGPDAYSSETDNNTTPPLWAIIAVVVGGVCILGLIFVIVLIMLKIQNMNGRREENQTFEMQRIQPKNKRVKGRGTDV